MEQQQAWQLPWGSPVPATAITGPSGAAATNVTLPGLEVALWQVAVVWPLAVLYLAELH